LIPTCPSILSSTYSNSNIWLASGKGACLPIVRFFRLRWLH
jgi:hypothetical protein